MLVELLRPRRIIHPALLLAATTAYLPGCDRPESAEVGAVAAGAHADSLSAEAPAAADFKSVASKIVNQSAGVREGDIVLVSGRDQDLPLLEEIALEVMKVGGQPLVTVSTERFRRRSYDDVPAKFDDQAPTLVRKLTEMQDVFISTESGEGRTLKGVPPERMAARFKAMAPFFELNRKRGVRNIAIGNGLYPSAERAEQLGISREELAGLLYDAVDADYSQLQSTGEQIRKVLAAGKELRITSPGGTDLRVSIAGRPVVVSDGVISAEDRKRGGAALSVWLPAGEVFLTPVPGTANGVIVADHLFYQGDRIEGLRLEVKQGRMVGMTAKAGLDQLREYYDQAGAGKDVFAVVDIGINSAVKVPAGGALNVWSRAGAVTVGVGSNTWAGGDNEVNFFVAPEISSPTVEVDGKVLVDDGKLVAGTAVAGS